jgi:N-acetyltransferase
MKLPIPIILSGRLVRLEPLQEAHAAQLAQAGQDENIWRYMRYSLVNTEEKMLVFIRLLLEDQACGTALPFAVIDLPSGKAAGMTRYMDVQPHNLSLEIGGTWYGAPYQRTGINTECKFLLLRHAFEDLGVHRVQFKADARNERSLRAIERIGAVREGVLREHMVLPDGFIRSSVYYSILAGEWSAVKERLTAMMEAHP